MKYKKFDAKHLAGFLVALVTIPIVVWLLIGTVSRAGYGVPGNLPVLVKQAQAAGSSYTAPDLAATCTPTSKVDSQTKTDVKLVTGKDIQPCSYDDNSLHPDASWGIALGVLVAGMAILLFVVSTGDKRVHARALAASTIGAIVVTALLWSPVHHWIKDGKLDAVIFWHGFFIALLFIVGGWIVHEVHRKQDEHAAQAPIPQQGQPAPVAHGTTV